MRSTIVAAILVQLSFLSTSIQSKTFVGVAKTDITPTHPVLLAGYGGRPGEHVGVDQPIWARAIAIGKDKPVVLIAVDNCGVPSHVTRAVLSDLSESHGITKSHLVISSTHTHNAPVLRSYAPIVWAGRTTAEQEERVDRYTLWLTDQLIKTAQSALDKRQPASLSWGQGIVEFGGNRRILNNGKWAGFGFQYDGPVDHSLPVMVAKNENGDAFAVWTNYACHCTTVGSRNHIGGDWAGNANLEIEAMAPGVVALTTIGCGADVGPQPSGNMQIAKEHGKTIATEVSRLLRGELIELDTAPQAQSTELSLPLDTLPDKKHFEDLARGGGYGGNHAKYQIARIKEKGELQSHVDYPITCWKFDDRLAVVFLAGEVSVDYSVRLKNALDWRRLWLNAWSNDVPSYIPSKRLLREGGYETDFSQIYYGLPARYSPDIEDMICDAVLELVGESFSKTKDQPHPSFLKLPTSREWLKRNMDNWAEGLTDAQRSGIKEAVKLNKSASSGFSKLTTESPQRAVWFDYTGRQSDRPFFRQDKGNESLSWLTPPLELNESADFHTLLFLGGTGWISQPKTSGFKLRINGEKALDFDVALESAEWRNSANGVSMKYICTWQSDVDSAGLFFLRVPVRMLQSGKAATVTVLSEGTESLRWFSLDEVADPSSVVEVMSEAISLEESRKP